MATLTLDERQNVENRSSYDWYVRPADAPDGVRALEPEAWEALVREHSPRMLALARRFLRCEHDSADALQEAFLSAFRSIDSFAGQSSLSTWLHRIMVNVCLMKLRSKARRQTISVEELLPTFDERGRHARPVAAWRDDTDAHSADGDVREHVRECIARLPENYRAVLILRDVEQFDTEQAAEILGTTAANVKVRLHRARQALRTMLGPMFEANND